jgi:CheY-like chemotaxis protein
MSKTVLIVEKDLALMRSLRENLEHRGFGVEETTDGKGAPELIRRSRPDCVVLAVDLDAGQNGYIICKKLKSDPDLKAVPILIIGDPKGFESHQKLKTRADDYLGKPFAVSALVDQVGMAIGFPELPPMSDEGFDPGSMIEELPGEELVLDSALSDEPLGDPDFGMVDTVFNEQLTPDTELSPPPLDGFEEEISIAGPEHGDEEKTLVGFVSMPDPPQRRATDRGSPFQSTPSGAIDQGEARELRSRITELTGALEEARGQGAELETRLREVEAQLEARQTELDVARSAPSKGDSKEVFALRDTANKKDKEILRLKNELNAKEQEIVELREKENTLEQAASESSGDLARRDAQVKTLQLRADQLANERKRQDQQLLQAREEGRGSAARLSTLQSDYQAQQARLEELEAQLEPLRDGQAEAERAALLAEAALAEARGELDSLRGQLEALGQEADELRGHHERALVDLDATRNQVSSQATSFADEISGLRQRITGAEAEARRHEDRASRHQSRVKAQQEQLERLRASLQSALTTLDEMPADELDVDELAEA